MVALDDVAGNQRMAIEPPRKLRHAHAVIDGELQRLHALADIRVLVLPTHGIGVVGEAAQARECVIDVATAVVRLQRGVTGDGSGDADLLRPPVEIGPDGIG